MLTPAQRRFLTIEQAIAPALFNLVLNVAAGWLVFREFAPVRLWAEPTLAGLLRPNFAGDVFGMFFFLPFATCLVVTPLVRRAVQGGKVAPLTVEAEQHPLLRRLPRSVWRRATYVGAACSILIAPLAVGPLVLLGVDALPLDTAVLLKGVLAAALAALVTPAFALYALTPEADRVSGVEPRQAPGRERAAREGTNELS